MNLVAVFNYLATISCTIRDCFLWTFMWQSVLDYCKYVVYLLLHRTYYTDSLHSNFSSSYLINWKMWQILLIQKQTPDDLELREKMLTSKLKGFSWKKTVQTGECLRFFFQSATINILPPLYCIRGKRNIHAHYACNINDDKITLGKHTSPNNIEGSIQLDNNLKYHLVQDSQVLFLTIPVACSLTHLNGFLHISLLSLKSSTASLSAGIGFSGLWSPLIKTSAKATIIQQSSIRYVQYVNN